MQSNVKDTNKTFPRTIRETVCDRSNAVGIVIVCACALALSFLSEASPFSTAYPSVDSGVFTYIGEHILQGQMPYLDIFDHKGPLLYVINAIAAAIDGPQHATVGIWLCELVAILVAMVTTYCMCRRFSRSWFAVLATCLGYGSLTYALFGGNYVQEFACVPVAIALYLFSGYVVRRPLSNKACFGVGVTAGAAFLLQPNMLAAWGVFGIGILIHMGITGNGKRIVPTITWALAGFAVFCAPFLVWIVAGGAWDAFIDCYFRFNSEYAATFGRSDLIGTILWQFTFPVLPVAFICLVALCVGKHGAGDRGQTTFFWVLYLVSFVAALVFSSLSGRHYTYYLMTLTPYLALPLAAASESLAAWAQKGKSEAKKAEGTTKPDAGRIHASRGSRAYVAMAIIAVVCLVLAAYEARSYRSSIIENARAYEALSTDDPSNGSIYTNGYALVQKVDELSSPDDKIVVCFSDAWVFVESDRSSASRYIFQPEDTRLYIRENLLWDDVRNNQPKLVIVPQYATYFVDYLHGLPGYERVWSDSEHIVYERIDS